MLLKVDLAPVMLQGLEPEFRQRSFKEHDAKKLNGIYMSFMFEDQMGTLKQ